VGDVHVKVSKEEDSGPVNLTKKMREERRYDKVVGKKEVQLSKDELMHNLVQVGINKPLGSRQKLQLLCQQNNLPAIKTGRQGNRSLGGQTKRESLITI
jgi:hypothetical protein